MILYHVTQKRYLKSILKNGLLAYNRLSYLYLSGNITTAQSWKNILKEDYKLGKIKLIILQCEVKKYKIINRLSSGIIFEAISKHNIAPDKIKIIKE